MCTKAGVRTVQGACAQAAHCEGKKREREGKGRITQRQGCGLRKGLVHGQSAVKGRKGTIPSSTHLSDGLSYRVYE